MTKYCYLLLLLLFNVLNFYNMAICNLFSDLTNASGNFLMFSQYVEDITKSYAEGDNNYKIIDVNLKGYFLVTKNAISKLKETGGNIVFV